MAEMTDGERIAEERITEAARTGQDWLDLGELALKSLPKNLTKLPNLQRLSFSKHYRVTARGLEAREAAIELPRLSTLENISGIANLRELYLDGTDCSDLMPIMSLVKLQHLSCSDTKVHDLTPLRGLADLRHLDFSNTKVHNLAPLKGLTQLRHLDCSQTSVQDLTPLLRLRRLKHLDLQRTPVSDLTALMRLTDLEYLNCMQTNVRDLRTLSGLKRLEFLSLGLTKVQDLEPLRGLDRLVMLFLWHTRVSDIAPLIRLQRLKHLDLDETGVSDLSALINMQDLTSLSVRDCQIGFLPAGIGLMRKLTSFDLRGNKLRELPKELGGLSALEQGARSGSLGGGLWLDGNPLEYPLPDLIAPGQPKATINVLRWLRGEPISSGTEASDPPAIPEQGAGPRVILDQTGRLVFARPSDLDAKGNDRNRLEALHPALREAAADLVKALQDQTSNLRNERLLQKAEAYRALVDVPLEEVDFARLYAAGMQLLNAAGATRKALETGRADVPDLTPIQDECLANIENLHPPFVLASREGQEMLADQTTIKLTAEAVEGIKEAGTELGEELINHPDLADREVGEIIRDAAAEIGQGENDARDAVNTVSTMRNTVIVLATASKWAAIPTAVGYVAGGLAVAGAAAGATLWWFGTKVAEKTKAFQTDVERVQKALSTEANKLSVIRNRIEGHQSLLLKVEPKLRKITQLPGFTWLGPSLDLLKRKSSGDKEQ